MRLGIHQVRLIYFTLLRCRKIFSRLMPVYRESLALPTGNGGGEGMGLIFITWRVAKDLKVIAMPV